MGVQECRSTHMAVEGGATEGEQRGVLCCFHTVAHMAKEGGATIRRSKRWVCCCYPLVAGRGRKHGRTGNNWRGTRGEKGGVIAHFSSLLLLGWRPVFLAALLILLLPKAESLL